MHTRITALLGRALSFLGWPLRQLRRVIVRLWAAVLEAFGASWQLLGRLVGGVGGALGRVGLVLRRHAGRLVVLVAQPLWHGGQSSARRLGSWASAVGRLVLWPIRALGRGIRWIAPFIWEELGRLGVAFRRVAAVITWPVTRPVGLFWRRVLRPPLNLLWNWLTLRATVIGRGIRSRRQIQSARRQLARRERLAAGHHRPPPAAIAPPRLIRVVAGLASLNLVLLVLLARAHMADRPAAEARLVSSATPMATSAPVQTRLPTITPLPTMRSVAPTDELNQESSGGSVAFVIRRNGNDDIYAISAGDERPARLTNHPADDRSPSWSPDGSRLAFASRRDGNWELYVLDVADGSLTRMTWNVSFDGCPSWSPDGNWLVYESYEQENLDIYILPVDGGERIRLTTDPAVDYAPAWSPSGRHVSFVSRRGGSPDIYILALDDARDETAVNISQSPDVEENWPTWHPNGEFLAYSGRTGNQELVQVQPMLNNLPLDDARVIGQGREPAWAPGGSSLVYIHEEDHAQYLVAGAINSWEAAPRVYRSEYVVSSPTWGTSELGLRLIQAGSFSELPDGYLTAPPDRPLFREIMADPIEDGPPFTLVTLEDIEVPGPYLNDRVDDSFGALRQRVLQETGWDLMGSLDTVWEPLDAIAPPGLESTSWNKAGRAFDLSYRLNDGHNPPVEVVRESMGAKTWWRVYVRTERQDGSHGEPLRVPPWNFAARYSGNISDYENGGRTRTSIPTGYYIDFTQLAADYGWQRVPAMDTWRTFFPATLFWHFENRQGLDWEAAMLELYPEKELPDLVDASQAEY